MFVTSLNRLTATEANTFRQKLHAAQSRFIVVQRKLAHRSLESLGLQGLGDLLEGSVGLVLSGEDALPTAKTIVEFIKSHENHLAVRGALIDGQLLDKLRVEELASLPPKPVLLGQVVSTIEAPIANLILTLEQLIGDLAWAVEQLAARPPTTPPAAMAEATPQESSKQTPTIQEETPP
jgi:large subunit ribosomal protein L10